MESYSDEQGFCSYFWIVERGLNHKFLYINLFWKFSSIERLSRCFLDEQPSYSQTTLCRWMSFICWVNLLGPGWIYRRIGDSPTLSSPLLLDPYFKINGWKYRGTLGVLVKKSLNLIPLPLIPPNFEGNENLRF